MGVNVDVQEFFQKFETNLNSTLTQSGASSSVANCNVTIGSISFESSTNCSILVENKCLASAETSTNAIVKAMTDAFNSLSSTQQTNMAALTAGINVGVDTTKQNFVSNMATVISQRCSASSTANSDFSLGTLKYGKCQSFFGNTTIKFINTGHAQSNCAMKIVNDLQLAATNSGTGNQSTTMSGLSKILAGIFSFFSTFGTRIFIAIGIIIFLPIIVMLYIRLFKTVSKNKLVSHKESDFVKNVAMETIKNEPLHWSLYSKFLR